MREARTTTRRVGYASILGLAMWVGLATDSDALWLAWLAGALLCATIVLLTKVTGRMHPALTVAESVRARRSRPRRAARDAGRRVDLRGAGGGRRRPPAVAVGPGADRVLKSPIIGRGPGSQNLLARLGTGGEAHNSYLDLALATGLVGLGAAIWLTLSLVLRSSLLARPLLWSAFVAMQCFIMFHYMFRHPLFWFYAILMASFAYRDYEARLRPRPLPAAGPAELRLRRA